jgi:hypothetical protein
MIVEPEPTNELGLNVAVTLAGTPVAARVVWPARPEDAVTVAVYCALPPMVTVREAGVVVSENPGLTVNVAEAVCCSEPLVPVMVNG